MAKLFSAHFLPSILLLSLHRVPLRLGGFESPLDKLTCVSGFLNCTKESKMDRDEQEDTTIYKVVVNHEEQYSIWPADRENPLGWQDAGKSGLKAECLAYIKEVWTDMRPLSLRKKMVEATRKA